MAGGPPRRATADESNNAGEYNACHCLPARVRRRACVAWLRCGVYTRAVDRSLDHLTHVGYLRRPRRTWKTSTPQVVTRPSRTTHGFDTR